MNIKDRILVYSTDLGKNRKCSKCGFSILECVCQRAPLQVPKTFHAVLRLEKSGRSGKVVTVIDRLPKVETFLKDLARKLKIKCGSGGTYRMDTPFGNIEIQGDRRDRIRELLVKEGIKTKG